MRPNTVILGLLVALAAVAPLPFGGAPNWAGGMLAVVVGGLLATWGALVLRGAVGVARPPKWFWLPAGLFLAALGWAVAQTLTGQPALPPDFSWEGSAAFASIALDPVEARASAVGIGACASAFWLALQTGRRPERAAWAFTALGFAVAANAVYGLLVHLSGTNTILWFPKTAYHDVVTGTFVNRNTFATHAGLGLLCVAAALGGLVAKTAGQLRGRERVRLLLSVAPVRKVLLIGAGLLLGLAILLSESRAGAGAAVLALTAFLSMLALRGRKRWRAVAVTAGAIGAGLLFASLGEGLEQRLWSAEADWEFRRQIAVETVEALRTAPLRGVGLGGFEAAHRAYRESGGAVRIERAHNDYLQTALELGVPGALAYFASFALLALACVRGALGRGRAAVHSAAGFAACVLVGAHSAVDFSLRMPAVSLLFSLMLGLAVAQARQSGGGGSSSSSRRRRRVSRDEAEMRP